jgi:hypothetical protein
MLLAVVLAISACALPEAQVPRYVPEEGDVLFQSLPRAPLVDAIEGATRSKWSHCGLVVRDGEGWGVLEAIGPVKVTPFADWVAQARDGRFAAYRWRERPPGRVAAIIAAARTYLGRPYDVHYAMDDERIYCSELVEKAFATATGRPLGKRTRLGELNWQPYKALIREIEGGNLPLEREIVSPRALTESPELAKVD